VSKSTENHHETPLTDERLNSYTHLFTFAFLFNPGKVQSVEYDIIQQEEEQNNNKLKYIIQDIK
jgi:hypothetical protein